MDVSETDLPGVGKRFEVDLRSGGTAVVLVHNSGRRELFFREEPDADAEELLELTDEEARVVGTIVEGAYFQPVGGSATATLIGDDLMLEWYTLEADADIVGESIEEADVRNRTGATIVAIDRDGDVLQNPSPSFTFAEGDQLVIIGKQETQAAFQELL